MDDRDPSGRFVRGLTLGALLGAIIAGSSMWRRSKAARPTKRTPAPAGPRSATAAPIEPDPIDSTDVELVRDGGPRP